MKIIAIKQWIKERIECYFFSLLSIISISLNIRAEYYYLFHEKLNLSNPRSFEEKIAWAKINVFPHNKLIKQCSDKYMVRDYVKKCGYEEILPFVYYATTDVGTIDFEKLPESFVIKCSNGWNNNYVVNDKGEVDFESLIVKCKKWLNNKYYLRHGEYQYKFFPRRIIIEELLKPPNGMLLDYKFYCFDGVVKAILVIERSLFTKGVMLSRNWEVISKLEYRYEDYINPIKPDNLEEMIDIAERLSEEFRFVRIDMYSFDSRIVFGEMTFCPNAGLKPSEAKVDNRPMGEYIML